MLFFQIGLLCALLITVSAFEWTTKKEKPVVTNPDALHDGDDFIIPVTKIEDKKPPKPKKINPVEVKNDEPEDPLPAMPDLMVKPVPVAPAGPLPEWKEETDDKPADYVDTMPSPVGGYEAFYQYVARNVTYTRQARELSLEGRVFVQFVVDKDGRLTEVKVVRGLGAGLDEEAKKVMENAAPWNPGRQSGRRVKVRMIIPIHFRLQ